MIVLCGLPLSNYYNKVKLVLLEKGVPFTEERVSTGSREEAVLAASPLGKIPFIRTPQGALCESQVIVDWLEAAYPEPALVPAEPFAAAKVRELATFIDLHLELVARELYGQAFFGGTASEATQQRVRKTLDRHIPAVCVRPTHLDGRGRQAYDAQPAGVQRCGSNSSTRLAGCVGRRSSTSLRYA
jgi:glutathione S-transferase